jgi:hypothetical protein
MFWLSPRKSVKHPSQGGEENRHIGDRGACKIDRIGQGWNELDPGSAHWGSTPT